MLHKRTRLKRSQLRPHVRAYVLDPTMYYEIELAMVLRVIYKWVAKKGWAPALSEIVKARDWNARALERYVDDLLESGLVRMMPGHGWMPTEAGFKAAWAQPVMPRYSTNCFARHLQRKREREAKNADALAQEIIACHNAAVS